jgi:hypothetical protein
MYKSRDLSKHTRSLYNDVLGVLTIYIQLQRSQCTTTLIRPSAMYSLSRAFTPECDWYHNQTSKDLKHCQLDAHKLVTMRDDPRARCEAHTEAELVPLIAVSAGAAHRGNASVTHMVVPIAMVTQENPLRPDEKKYKLR